MPAPTISPAVRCPATARPNACCGATWRRRSAKCRPISRKSQPESLRLLSPDPRGGRHGALGATTARATDQTVFPGAGKTHAVRARLHRRAVGAFDRHRDRSHAGQAAGRASRAVRPGARATAPAPGRPPQRARPTPASTWAPASTASIAQPHRQRRDRAEQKARARHAARGDAPARLQELFPRMVALHLWRPRSVTIS